MVEKILWLRQQYHFGFVSSTTSVARGSRCLNRYHNFTISASGVWRIQKKVGLNRLPASQRYKRAKTRWERYEKQRPGDALRVDVTFIEPLGQTGRKKRYYQYTAINDCTRLRVFRAYATHDRETAIRFIDHVLSKRPFKVEKVPTDDGSELGQSFHWHLLDKGLGHTRIRPATPRLSGKVERSHRIDSEEFHRLLEGRVIDDLDLFQAVSSNGKTTTTTIDHTEPSPEGHATNDSSRRTRTHCDEPPSVAHLADAPAQAGRGPDL